MAWAVINGAGKTINAYDELVDAAQVHERLAAIGSRPPYRIEEV